MTEVLYKRKPIETIPVFHADGSLWFNLELPEKGAEWTMAPVDRSIREPRILHRQANDYKGPSKCYFIGGDKGPVKIGHSIAPEVRCAGFQCGSPVELKVLAVRQGGPVREVAYHAEFAEHRLHGEWFKRTPAIRREIKRLQHAALNTEAVA